MMTSSFDAADAFGALVTTESLTDAQIEERAQALLDQLTLDEKIALMDGDPPFSLQTPASRQCESFCNQCC